MRHSDIQLSMGVYTDPALLSVRDALEILPQSQYLTNLSEIRDQKRDLENVPNRQNGAFGGINDRVLIAVEDATETREMLGNDAKSHF